MKAIVRDTYGSPDVLELTELATPTPKDDEVLIKVHAASVNAADWRMLRADPFLARLDVGLLKPRNKILGFDVAGVEIEHVLQAGAHVLGVVDHAGEPEPSLLVALVGLDQLHKQGASFLALAGPRCGDPLLE